MDSNEFPQGRAHLGAFYSFLHSFMMGVYSYLTLVSESNVVFQNLLKKKDKKEQ